MKTYWVQFSSGDSRTGTGLTPTFVIFQTSGGSLISAPSIAEVGASTGMYSFTYGPTAPIAFLLDGGASLADSVRYVSGALDPIQAVDEKVGTSADSFGTTNTDPTSIFGYVKRNLEIQEGNETFNKTTGVWDRYSRGSSTLLNEKTLTNSASTATKS